MVRSDAFAGQDFEGKISSLAQALGPSRLGQRGPRRPTDVDVLEVIIDLTGKPPLLPGMRVDVFLKADAPGQPAAAAQADASHQEAMRHIEAIEAILNGEPSTAGTSGTSDSATAGAAGTTATPTGTAPLTLDRAKVDQLRMHLNELKRLLNQAK